MKTRPLLLTVLLCCGTALAQSDFRTVNQGVYSTAQSTSGAALYRQHCSHCHDPLFLRGALRSWEDMTVLDLWYRLLGAMPADNPRSLSQRQYLDLVAFMLALRGYPAGEQALEVGNGLGRIRIVAPR